MASPLPPTWTATPKPMTDRGFWTALADQPHLQPTLRTVLARAEQAAPRPELGHASDYLAARRSNDRARIDHVWQSTRLTLAALTIRRCILGLDDADPDDRLLDWLWAFLTQPTWVVSAHLPNNDLPAAGSPQLDLAACEMAAGMAELREVTRPWIDSASKTLADTIVAEIDRRVLGPFGDGVAVGWHPEHPAGKHLNNWTGVCAGSILAACESLAAQGQPRPKARERALDALDLYFRESFTEHGECDEGVGYWTYGVGFACVGLQRLDPREIRERFDMDRLASIADYPRRAHLFGNAFHYGNDTGMRASAALWFVPWLAALTQNPWLAAWARTHPSPTMRSLPTTLRDLAVPAAAMAGGPGLPEPAPSVLLPDQQTAIFRARLASGPALALLTGGDNAERHNHNDLGHFCVAFGEQMVVPDLGNVAYTTDFFGPKRYTYLPASSRGHCCPVIDGHEQRAGSAAACTVLDWDPDAGRFEIEATAAYPPEARLERWTRSLTRHGRHDDATGFTIADRFATQAPGVEVVHVVWSLEEPQGDAGEWRLGPITMSVTPPPQSVAVREEDPKALRMREFNDRRLFRLELTYHTGAAPLDIQTRFTPTA